MDYAVLPPEINSARMYIGPGAASLLAAAGSWDALSAELDTTAEVYGSVLSTLAGMQWYGPAAQSMSATAAPYVGWLSITAERTKQTAIQARVAAAAYEQAFAMTVPPPVIAANRAQLTALIATNFFGQNTAAIAATEATYAEMWVQDAAAMNGYATTSAAASRLTPFASPAETTNASGLTAQSAAVSQAQAVAAASDPVSALVEVVETLFPNLAPGQFGFLDGIAGAYATTSAIQDFQSFVSGIIGAEKNLGILPNLAEAAKAAPVLGEAPKLGNIGGAGLRSAITATLARANSIGPLSVPASWTAPSKGAVTALSGSGLTVIPGTEAVGGAPGIPGVPAGTVARASMVAPRYGNRLTVMPRPPAAG